MLASRNIMAIFQYKIEAIPTEFAIKFKGNISQALEDCFAWENYANPSKDYIDALRGLLPIDSSWGETEEYKSDSDWQSQLQIFKTDEKIERILLKYSPLSDSVKILRKFVELSNDEGCSLYSVESKKVFKPNFDLIIEDLKSSNSMKFSKDPEKTILKAADKIKANKANSADAKNRAAD